MSAEEHRARSTAPAGIRVAVVSVSDSRTRETDEGGAMCQALAEQYGFAVIARELVPDDSGPIRTRVQTLCQSGADAILVTGGTGVAPRDRTVDTIAPLFDRRLDGFGELFRMLSFAEIGAAAYLSRATAGFVGPTVVFLMPGSPAGVRLALEKLILPELGHLIGELRRPAATRAGDASAHTPQHRDHQRGHRP